jgi:hypothetical protein
MAWYRDSFTFYPHGKSHYPLVQINKLSSLEVSECAGDAGCGLKAKEFSFRG